MSKPKQKINPHCGNRLKELCKCENITQTTLSKKAMVSQNTISKIINGKSPLSYPIASDIHRVFPRYRIEWLMGKSEHKTELDNQLAPIAANIAIGQCKEQAFSLYTEAFGFSFKFKLPEKACGNHYNNMKFSDITQLDSQTKSECWNNLFSTENIKGSYYSVTHNGKEVARLSFPEYKALQNEIADFVEFKLSKLYKEENNG